MNLALRMVATWIDRLAKLLIVVFMLSPVVLVIVLSFSADTGLIFPPRSWGFDLYVDLAQADYWLTSVLRSLVLATVSAVICLVIGIPAVYALQRSRIPFAGVLTSLGLAPLILPSVAYAVAMYTLFIDLDLIGTPSGLLLAHVILSLPFVLLIVGAALRRIPEDLELVAMTLGASRTRAVLGITVRLLFPAVAASFIFCFIHSFDEATFVNFVAGADLVTLPKAIFDSIRTGLDPIITAIAGVLMVVTGIVMSIGVALRRKSSYVSE